MNLGILLVITLIFLYSIDSIESKRTRKCRPERNKYYNFQKMRCKRCKSCEDGQEKDLTQPLNISEEFGALDCYPCMECSEGQYSNYRDTDRNCVECSRNCAEEHRDTLSLCNGKQEAQCGNCIPMYYDMMGVCHRCSQKDTSRPECTRHNSRIVSTPTQVSDTQKETVRTQATGDKNKNPAVHHIINNISVSMLIIVIAVCGGVVTGIIFAIYKLYTGCKKCRRDEYGTMSTIGSTSSGRTLESKPVEYKGLAQDDLEVDSAGFQLEENEKTILLHQSDEFICLTTRFMDKSPDDLFDRLDVDSATRYQANEHFPKNMPEVYREVLNKWVSKSGEGATLGNLFEHLVNGKYELICKNIVKQLKINNTGHKNRNEKELNDLSTETVV